MEINVTFLITAICSFVLCLYIFFSRPQSKINITFSLLVFFYALWVASFLLFSTANHITALIFWAKVMHVSASLVPISFLCFSYFFPWDNFPKRKLLNFVFVSLPVVLILLTVFSDIMFGGYNPAALSIGEKITPNPAYSLYLIYYLIFSVLTLYNFVKKFLASTGNQRDQIRYVLYSTCLSTFFVVLVTVILPILKIYTLVWTGPFYILFAILVSSFAITKHELLDIRVIIGRSVAYGLVAVLLVVSFIALNASRMPVLISMISNAALALIWAWAAHKLREIVQTPLDKWISWYKPEDLLNSIVKELGLATEREEALNIVAAQLQKAIKIKKVNILLGKKDGESKPFEYTLLEAGEGYLKPLLSDHPFIANLRDMPVGKAGAIHYSKLSPKIKESIKELDFLKDMLYLSLFSADGLEGVIILGQKVSEDSYDKKDFTFFDTLIIQAKSFLDRIRPYEKVKKDFEANQKKLYDTERLLARSEKIASMANLIQEYNHEIKTPLTVIKGRMAELTKKPQDEESLQKFVNLMMKHINRIDDIVETTLRLSSPKERKEIKLDINELIDTAFQLFPPSGVHVVRELSPVPLISGDKEDLQTVFVNLIKNAVEAMPDGGNLTVKTYAGIDDSKPVVYAEISDTGVGIPAENIEKIFEPFFSTHVTKGRGLGLSVVFRIIREHLGKIDVHSQVGHGSTFKIQFRQSD